MIKLSGIQYVPLDAAKELVARIPNAQLAVIEGTSPDSLEAVVQRYLEFINGDSAAARAGQEFPSGTAIILFADIVDSTTLTEQLGDTAFRERARRLDEAMRKAITQSNGTAVDGKLLGDGVLAVFTAARDAINAALACRDAARDARLELHLGLHAGDVIRERTTFTAAR